MALGILAGLLAGAFWGIMFVAPRAVEPFTALDLTIVRYALFALISALLMLHPAMRPRHITRQHILAALMIGVTGYVGYFMSVSYAVQLAGPAIPPLIIGAVPVLLAIIGNWGEKGIAWKALAFPLTLIACGIGLVNSAAIFGADGVGSMRAVILGTLCAVLALVIWLVYAIINARAMRGSNPPSALQWTCLQGLGTGVGILMLIPYWRMDGVSSLTFDSLATGDGQRFLAWAIFLGVISSWLAGWLWIEASRRLPLALTAQLVVAETVFALLFGFTYESRMPSLVEAIGIALQLVGVVVAVALFTRRSPAKFEESMSKDMAEAA